MTQSIARSRGYDPLFRSVENTVLLNKILLQARLGGIGVFDLDGCLFDTRPRQVQIFREFASKEDFCELYQVLPEHFKDWSLEATLRNAGIGERRIEDCIAGLREYWRERFFTSTYVGFDHAMPGAVSLVRQVQASGMRIVYLTGRDASMREGTEDSLRRWGFPIGTGQGTLIVKPTPEQEDTAFKEQALEFIAQLGKTRLYMDNEPSNVNLFHARHPEALVVFVETDHSPRPVVPVPGLPWLRSFCR